MSGPAESGLLVVDKPAGLTSHDVVARVRRLAGTRKVGHAGTLDPMATGVLVVGVNRATRLLGHLMLTEKAYDATLRLGVATTTDDAQGEVLAESDASALGEERIRTVLTGFVGDLTQVPAAVSAVKVDGRRAYRRVREGEQVTLAPRQVTVHELVVHEVTRAGRTVDVRFSLRCSSGTYVRAVARDAGAALGVGGHLVALRRTAVGGFGLDRARTLEQLAEHLTLLPLAEAARECFPGLDLGAVEAAQVRHGRALALDLGARGPVALFDPSGELLALYEQQGTTARAVAVFAA